MQSRANQLRPITTLWTNPIECVAVAAWHVDRPNFVFVCLFYFVRLLSGGGQGGTKMQGPLRWCSLFSFLTLQKFWQPLGTWIETLILSHCKTWLATCYSDSIHTGCFHWIADIASNFGSSLSCTTTVQFHVNNRICLPCESYIPRSPKDEVRYYGTWPLLVWYDTQYYLEILGMIMNDTWHNMIWYYCNLESFDGKSSSLQANRCRFHHSRCQWLWLWLCVDLDFAFSYSRSWAFASWCRVQLKYE